MVTEFDFGEFKQLTLEILASNITLEEPNDDLPREVAKIILTLHAITRQTTYARIRGSATDNLGSYTDNLVKEMEAVGFKNVKVTQ